MKQYDVSVDSRIVGICIYCGGIAKTRDHVPSKAFLDKPYPENIPVVPCCFECNNKFSKDEEYVVCAIECLKCYSTDVNKIEREKVRSTLRHTPTLQTRIESYSKDLFSDIHNLRTLKIEKERFDNVIRKLVLGHLFFENSIISFASIKWQYKLLPRMNSRELEDFLTPYQLTLSPEVASRALHRMILINGEPYLDWEIVQPNLYQYCTSADGSRIKIIISNYMAIEAYVE